MSLPLLSLALLAPLAVIGCSPDGAPRRGPVGGPDPVKPTEALRPADRERVRLDGVIAHVPIEGGVWVIRTDEGAQYRVVELPRAFQENGLRVELEGLLHDDVLTRDMAGQAIDIVEIRRVAGP